MRSAADMDDVGCPDPAASLDLIESTRSCRPNSRQSSTLPIMPSSRRTRDLLATVFYVPRLGVASGA